MSVQDALAFIQKVGRRPDLQARLRSLGGRPEPGDIVDIGGREGHAFTIEEFRTAFAGDWAMRRLFYCAQKDPE